MTWTLEKLALLFTTLFLWNGLVIWFFEMSPVSSLIMIAISIIVMKTSMEYEEEHILSKK